MGEVRAGDWASSRLGEFGKNGRSSASSVRPERGRTVPGRTPRRGPGRRAREPAQRGGGDGARDRAARGQQRAGVRTVPRRPLQRVARSVGGVITGRPGDWRSAEERREGRPPGRRRRARLVHRARDSVRRSGRGWDRWPATCSSSRNERRAGGVRNCPSRGPPGRHDGPQGSDGAAPHPAASGSQSCAHTGGPGTFRARSSLHTRHVDTAVPGAGVAYPARARHAVRRSAGATRSGGGGPRRTAHRVHGRKVALSGQCVRRRRYTGAARPYRQRPRYGSGGGYGWPGYGYSPPYGADDEPNGASGGEGTVRSGRWVRRGRKIILLGI